MEKSVPSAKKKFSIRDIMTIAAMMVICFIIMMVMSSLTLPFPLVYLYGSAGIDGFICAVFFLVAANRVNKHGLLFAWAGIYGLIQGVMGYMFLFPYFLAVGLIAELSMLGKDTYRNPLRTRIGWTINCVGNFVGCAVPLWWAWDSYTAMALESGFTSETLEMQMANFPGPDAAGSGNYRCTYFPRDFVWSAPIAEALPKSRYCGMNRTGTTQKRIEQVDGRTVLFLTVCSCLVSFLTTDLIGHAVFTFWLLLILCYFGLYKQGIGCYTVYLVTVVGLYLETKYSISFPSPLLLSMIYKLLLPAMPAYLLFRIPSGKLTASLRKLPIPAKAMLVLVVMLRFAPTIILEFGEVREAMKIRGFLRSVPTVLRHPLNTLEYAIVPMVFRSLKIADELSASAIVRGIESPYKKQSYYVSRISPLDAFLMLVSTAAGIVCCVLL